MGALYAKARAGLIKGFTGIDDPYEAAETPEENINILGFSPDEAPLEILLKLERLVLLNREFQGYSKIRSFMPD